MQSAGTRIAAVSLLLISAYSAAAAEPVAEAEPTKIVFRISRELIRKHHIPEVDESSPVDTCLFGSRVTGTSRTSGRTTVTMDANEKDAVFTFQFRGSTVSNTVATKRPVSVFSTGTTEFFARRQIHFDGLRFRADPASIDASAYSKTDFIGVSALAFNRVIRRIAAGEVEKNKPAAEAIALRDVKAGVLASFDSQTDKLVAQLNGIVPYESAFALVVPKAQGWIYHLATKPDYLLLSPGPAGASIAVLPADAAGMRAPLELWLRQRPDAGVSGRLISEYLKAERSLDRFRALVTGVDRKPAPVEFTAVGDWWVLRIGGDLMEKWIEKIEKDKK